MQEHVIVERAKVAPAFRSAEIDNRRGRVEQAERNQAATGPGLAANSASDGALRRQVRRSEQRAGDRIEPVAAIAADRAKPAATAARRRRSRKRHESEGAAKSACASRRGERRAERQGDAEQPSARPAAARAFHTSPRPNIRASTNVKIGAEPSSAHVGAGDQMAATRTAGTGRPGRSATCPSVPKPCDRGQRSGAPARSRRAPARRRRRGRRHSRSSRTLDAILISRNEKPHSSERKASWT